MTLICFSFFFLFVFEEKSAFFISGSADAVEESSGEDDDWNVPDEIKNKYNK